MSTLSIPAVVMASITFYVGAYHLLVYLGRREHREDLTFALLCLAVGLYAALCAGLYNATSVAEGAQWQRRQFIVLPLVVTAFLWFAADYTGQLSKKVLYAFTAYYAVAVIIQMTVRNDLTWIVDPPAIKVIHLPFSLTVTYYEANQGLLTDIQGAIGLAAGLYVLWGGVCFYRGGNRQQALPLLAAMGIFFAAGINDTAVSVGLYNFIYTMEYAYAGMVLLMTRSLSIAVVQAAAVEGALQQHAERLRVLHAIDQAILAARSPEEIARVALLSIRQLVPCQRASIALFDPETGMGRVLAIHANGETKLGTGAPLLDIASLVADLRQGEIRVIDDIQSLPELHPRQQTLQAEGIRTYLNIPLRFQDTLIGSLNLGTAQPNAFGEEHIEIAREVADQVAIAIHQTHLLDSEREQRVLAEALCASAAALSGTLALDEVLARILDNVGRVVPHDAANIMLIEEGVARIVGRRGYAERGLDEAVLAARYPVDDTANLHHMLETGESLLLPDVPQYPGWVRTDQTRWIHSYVGAPVHLEGRVIGFVNLDSATTDFFTPEHARRLQAFTDQAAVAIRNARLFEAEQQRRRVAETLRQAAAVLGSTLELDEVLDLILQQLRGVIAYDSATIQLIEDDHLLVMAAQGFERAERVVGLEFPIVSKFPNMRVITGKKPLAINDVTHDYPHFQDEATTYESGHIRAWLGVPLTVKDQVIGMITLDRTEVQPYTDEDVELAMALANQAAIAVENAWLHRTTQERATRLELVGQLGRRSTAILAPDELIHQAVELIGETFGYYYTCILLVEGDELVFRATTFPAMKPLEGQIRLHVGAEGITGWVADKGEPLLVPDVSRDSRFYFVEEAELATCSELAVPIKLRDQVIGVLDVQSNELDAFSETDVATLQTIADQLAVAINNARLFEQVQRHADELERRVAERTAELEAANKYLKALSRAQDEFVSNVSHELHTPITSLKLYIQLLTLKPDMFTTYVNTLERETERLANLINGLLTLSRLDQNRLTMNLAPIDLNALAEEYVTDRALLAEERELTLTLDTQPGLPDVQADRSLMGQVLSILLTNALNYTPAGGQVAVSTQVQESENQQWVGMSVCDTGPGVSPEEMPHVFKRFFRGQAGRRSGASGTGLGLSIAEEIVERHHGHVEVESEGVPGKGATFTVWLPAAGSEAAATQSHHPPNTRTGSP